MLKVEVVGPDILLIVLADHGANLRREALPVGKSSSASASEWLAYC